MALSMREKLKAANQANAANRGNTSTDDTIFADFSNREDDALDNDSKGKLVKQEEDKFEEKKSKSDTKVINKKASKDKVIKSESNNTEECSSEDVTQDDINIKDIAEQNEEDSKLENGDTEINKYGEYVFTQPNVSVTILMSETIDNYLWRKAVHEGITYKQCFKNILLDELKKPVADLRSPVVKQFQRIQHNQLHKTITIEADFKEAIKEKAKLYYMKYTAFIGYALERARMNDLINDTFEIDDGE